MHKAYIRPGYLLMVLVLLIYSCNGSGEKNGLIIKKSYLTFSTPELMPVNSQVQLIESDTADYLLLYNYFDKVYQFIEFPSGNLRQEIPLHFEGPNSVRGFTGGTYASLDSFWVLTQPPAISLMDFDGKISLKKKIENHLLPITIIGTSQDTPLIKYGNRI